MVGRSTRSLDSNPMDEAIVGRSRPKWQNVVPFLAGVASPIAAYRIPQLLGIASDSNIIIAAFVAFLGCAVWATRVSSLRLWAVALAIYAGVPLGTFADVFVDAGILSHSRNMWPLEILQWWVVGAVPVAIGISLGRALR